MTYDALGRWVERGAGGGFTQRIFSPAGRELALTSGQTVATAYVPLPGGALVRYNSSGLDSYWHPDWLGTARLYSNTVRAVVNDVAYAPFGEWYINGPADSFFTGVAQSDAAADMKAFLARDYHTTQGRWLTPDPAGLEAVDLTNPQTLNRYAYVLGNPLGLVDPSGMAGQTIWIQIPTHCYQTEMTGLPGEYQFCDITFQQISVGPLNNPGGQPVGGGGSSQPLPPKNGFQNNKQIQACLNDYYGSKFRKTIDFFSTLGLVPGWSPNATENLKEIGTLTLGKYVGLKGLQTAANKLDTQEIVSLFGNTVKIPSSAAAGLDVGLHALGKAGMAATAVATTIDVIAHATCAMTAYPTPSVPSPF